MYTSTNAHIAPDDNFNGVVVTLDDGRTYGVLHLGTVTVFLGDSPAETRDYVANIREALHDIMRDLTERKL